MQPYRVGSVQVDDEYLHVVVDDVECSVSVDSIAVYSDRLQRAMREQRARYEVSTTGIHWPELDEDLSIRGLMRDAEKAVAVEAAGRPIS